MTPEQMVAAAAVLMERCPRAELVRNRVGGMAVVLDGVYIGYVEIVTGDVTLFENSIDVIEDEAPWPLEGFDD